MEHTKGPWHMYGYNRVSDSYDNQVCKVHPHFTQFTPLIAAAPDLLHELTELLETFKGCLGGSDPLYYEDFKDDIERAQRVIDKAKNGLG